MLEFKQTRDDDHPLKLTIGNLILPTLLSDVQKRYVGSNYCLPQVVIGFRDYYVQCIPLNKIKLEPRLADWFHMDSIEDFEHRGMIKIHRI